MKQREETVAQSRPLRGGKHADESIAVQVIGVSSHM